MSCCPTAPDIQVANISPDEPGIGPEVILNGDKPFDCTQVSTSITGSVGDKTEKVPGRIEQTAIVTAGDGSIDMQFTVSGSPPGVTWTFSPPSFTGNVTGQDVTGTSSGHFSGTFSDTLMGAKLRLVVTATWADGTDKRTYSFAPSKYDSKSSLKLQHPLPGSRVTSGYGARKPPKQGASSFHAALDFAYTSGVAKDVLAAADGEVIYRNTQMRGGQMVGYGNYVMLKHNGPDGKHLLTTVYAHMDAFYVSLGQKVAGGQSIGKEGDTGIGTGKHLHFEVRLPNNAKVDPTPYIIGGLTVSNAVKADNTPDGDASTNAAGDKGMTREQAMARADCIS